jgi:hypothetical protein
MHDRDAGQATETRQMAETDRQRSGEERALPYVLGVVVVFVIVVIAIIATR